MQVVVPFAVSEPKSRLSPVLDPDERVAFARAMLADVCGSVLEAGGEPTVLATERFDLPAGCDAERVDVAVDDRPLTEAVDAALGTDAPVAVVMADLALATPAALVRLFDAVDGDQDPGSDGDPAEDVGAREDGQTEDSGRVAIAPGRGGGTNALVVDHPDFTVDYHGASYLDHRANARVVGATVRVVDSFRLATDVDEPADLAEVLLHGEGRAREWLVDAGFELAVGESRVGVQRA